MMTGVENTPPSSRARTPSPKKVTSIERKPLENITNYQASPGAQADVCILKKLLPVVDEPGKHLDSEGDKAPASPASTTPTKQRSPSPIDLVLSPLSLSALFLDNTRSQMSPGTRKDDGVSTVKAPVPELRSALKATSSCDYHDRRWQRIEMGASEEEATGRRVRFADDEKLEERFDAPEWLHDYLDVLLQEHAVHRSKREKKALRSHSAQR